MLPDSYPALVAWLLLLLISGVVASLEHDGTWVSMWAVATAVPFLGRMDAFRLWPSAMLMVTYLLIRLRPRGRLVALLSLLLVTSVGAWATPTPHTFSRVDAMRRRVEKHVGESESIWVGPFDPVVYCATKRRSASKYYFILPWLTKPGVRETLLAQLETDRPRLIIDVSNTTYSTRQLLPGLDSMLAAHYVLIDQQGDVRYFLLRDAHDAPGRISPASP